MGDSAVVPDGGSDATTDATSDVTSDVMVDGGACPGQTQCGQSCVTLATDPNNCGACNKKCPGMPDGGAYGCVSGQCGDAIIDVAMGPDHTCVALVGGEVWCFGDNQRGELAMSTTTMWSPQPVKVPIDSVVRLAAGNDWTCALKSDHTVWCWGENFQGSLGHATGNGSPPDQSCSSATCNPTPQKVGGLPDVDQVFVEYAASCGRTLSGDVWCWGYAGFCGDFGDPTQAGAPNALPAPVANVHGVAKLETTSGGSMTDCVIGDAGGAVCWGANTYGETGHAPESTPPVCFFGAGSVAPPTAVPGITNVTSVSPSSIEFTCATVQTGALYCWGSNASGTVFPGTSDGGAGVPAPQQLALGTSAHAVKVVSGELSACVLLDDGTVRCWGQGGDGELGNGAIDGGPFSPLTPVTLSNAVNLFGVGVRFAALLKDGSLVTWGQNQYGELGHMPGTGSDIQCANGKWCGPAPSLVSGLP